MLNDKDEALYVKACVIPANEEDSQGDTLSSEDIKRIFTSYDNNNLFEIYHQGDQIEGVSLLENYINKASEPIGDRMAPSGSWLIIMKVTNPTIKDMVLSHEFEGVSLSSTVKKSCGLNLPDITTYSNVKDMECVTPQFISLVGKLGTDEGPSNGYPLEVMNYTTYIKKSKNGGKKLEVKEIVNALKDLVSKAESAEPDEAPVILKNEEPQKEDEEARVKKEECPDKKPEVTKESEPEAESVVNKEDAPTESATEESEEEPENNDDDSDARIAALEEKVAELEKAIKALQVQEPPADEEPAEEVPVEEDVKPKINKSKKTIITDEPAQVTVPSFNERTGRDEFGRKIRK